MLCPHCGANIGDSYKYCPSCGGKIPEIQSPSEGGPIPVMKKKPMPLWFKILGILAVIALIGVTAGILFTEGLVDVIDNQLTALRENKIDKAYQKYTAKEFQQATSIDEFKDFVEAYPIFTQNTSAHFTQRSLSHNIGTLRGNLTSPEHVKIPIEYKLIKEDGKWKILSIRFLKPDLLKTIAPPEEKQDLIKLVENQLHDIKEGQVQEAYYQFSSKEFKEATPLDAFEAFIDKYPVLKQFDSSSVSKTTVRNGIGIVSVELKKDDTISYIKYYLLHEDNQWKIWSLRILSPIEQEKEQSAEEALEPKMVFDEIILGNEIDDKGIIKNPTTVFKANSDNIYVNINVVNGIAGETVHLNFQHLDSHSSILAKAPIEENGDSVIESVFSAPEGGWPKGKYQLSVNSSLGLNKTVDFVVE